MCQRTVLTDRIERIQDYVPFAEGINHYVTCGTPDCRDGKVGGRFRTRIALH